MTPALTIVGLGEALFDIEGDQETLGGAPLNAAVHAHQMLRLLGRGEGVVVSRVGFDTRGRAALCELRARGMTALHVQTDVDHATGRVHVTTAGNVAQYEIVQGAAWDYLKFSLNMEELASTCDAVCFGSLAQRSPRSRVTIQTFLHHAPQAIKLYDANLRCNSYTREEGYTAEIVRQSCELADIVKLNREELVTVSHLLGLPMGDPDAQARALRDTFALRLVMVTRDRDGVVLYGEQRVEGAPAPPPPVPHPVGAGDACSAALLVGLLLGWDLQRIADVANRAGAYVAGQPSATPELPPEVLATGATDTQR